ncbi:Transposon Ty3-G Gag-Pol polyprotein [Araneus ventricosus]|uniref:Transposon Ty3-G Gag-Pol polyprotein n=1 Tax=Araneus ventricosus TaxID=182803 RepID=A0A4Y2PZF0_ARAVE|nr:Transposon Ty3-G Gag-Pol polyprotein [Araneus ventricosus]
MDLEAEVTDAMISIQKGNCVTSNFDLEPNVFRRNVDLLAVGIKTHKKIGKTQVCKEHKCKTDIITPFGLYEFNVMSFGLKNAPATFQRFMHERILRGLDFVFPYLDDILTASKSNKENEIHLNLVLERLNTFGLRINISKAVFAVEEIEFLGYIITPPGSRLLSDRVKAIMNYKRPENIPRP